MHVRYRPGDSVDDLRHAFAHLDQRLPEMVHGRLPVIEHGRAHLLIARHRHPRLPDRRARHLCRRRHQRTGYAGRLRIARRQGSRSGCVHDRSRCRFPPARGTRARAKRTARPSLLFKLHSHIGHSAELGWRDALLRSGEVDLNGTRGRARSGLRGCRVSDCEFRSGRAHRKEPGSGNRWTTLDRLDFLAP